MKKIYVYMLLIAFFWLNLPVKAEFVETFDSFTPLGVLQTQPSPINWDAAPLVNVVTAGTGKALMTTSITDKTFRHDGTGVNFGLTLDKDGIEYGFDFREDIATNTNMRMYLRDKRTAVYSPSFGLSAGIMIIRTNGEGGTTINGTNFTSSAIYGAGTAEDPGYWLKGDWLQFKIILKGPVFDIATVKAYNLSRGGLEIPTGLTGISLGANPKAHATWTGFNFRGGTAATYVDNAYVKDFSDPNPVAVIVSPLMGAYPVDVDGVVLSWVSDASITSHKIYFGTNSSDLAFQTEVTTTSYTIPSSLMKGTTYYWRIDEVRDGITYQGDVWNFTTEMDPVSLPRKLAYEGFDYVPYVDLKQSSNGYGGSGWATGWERANGEFCYVEVGPGSLAPAFYYPLGTIGNMIQHTNNATDNDAMRKLSTPIDLRLNQDYYISYLVKCDVDNFNIANLHLYEAKGASALLGAHMFYTGYSQIVTSADFALRDDKGAWTNRQFGSWTDGQVYLVVIKVSAQVTGNDTVYMSVFGPSNPLPQTEPTTWDSSFVTQQNKAYPWLAFSGRADGYDQFYFDEIHVGTGWGAVTGWVEACGDTGTIMGYDFNEDCQVNLKDFAKLAEDWMRCTIPGGAGCEMLLESTSMLYTAVAPEDRIVYEATSPITVNGDLSDWSDALWYNARFTNGYQTNLASDITSAQISLRWTPANPQIVYLAAKVTDISTMIDDTPEAWFDADNIEFRFSMNPTSTDATWSAQQNHDYDIAQLYTVGATSTGLGWCSLGSLGGTGTDAYTYLPAQNTIDIAHAVTRIGNEYIYEFAIPAYSDFAGIKGGTSSKATLSNDTVIAFDLQLNNCDGTTGGGLFANQSMLPNDWQKFTVKLNSAFSIGDFGYFDTDVDHNGRVGLSDLAVISQKWLSCTDPQIAGCDQPWAP